MARLITHISTSPYRQYIGLKCVEDSIGQDYSTTKYNLKNPEWPHVWFTNGLKVKGINLITAICDHPFTKNDAYVLTDHKHIEITDVSTNTTFDVDASYLNAYQKHAKLTGDIRHD